MVTLFWGVKDLDRKDETLWDASFIGKAVLDDEADFSLKEVQTSMLGFCEDLKKQEFVRN